MLTGQKLQTKPFQFLKWLRHSDAIQELTNFLDLSVQYDQMSEEEKIKWLIDELNTQRP